MFAAGLISSGVRKKPTFDDISNEFLAGMILREVTLIYKNMQKTS